LQRIVVRDGEPLDLWLADRATQLRQARQRATASSPSPALRVLFVSNPSAISGAESSTVELIGALRGDGVDAGALVAFEGGFTDRLRSAGCRVYCHDRDFVDDGIESWNLVSDAFVDFQPDVVHYCGRSGRIPLQVAAAMKRPVVFHGHVPFSEPYREAIGWANKYVAVSRSVSDAMLAAGLDGTTIVHIPNGIDFRSYGVTGDERQLLRQQFGVAPDAFVVITLGRLSPEKRLTDVVEALSLARRGGHRVELLMAGEAHSSQTTLRQITARVQDLALTSAVRLLGQVADVRPILGLADALVICSEYEGLPMAALEAMAAGVPIVATDTGALADLVGDRDEAGICGLRVRHGRPDD
jgi:glycosyltransferase involved in cell wall biosynthesis